MESSIKTIILEAVKVDDTKTGTTNGKDWTLWPIGIKIGEAWYNGAVFDKDSLELFKTGQEITLEFFKDPQYGWKFKLPTRLDILESRVTALELLNQIP